MSLLAGLVSAVLFSISGIHFYWAAGGKLGANISTHTLPNGKRGFQPGVLATRAVALGLALAGILILANLFQDLGVIKILTIGLAGIFALRTVGDFHYIGLFKSFRESEFAKWDSNLYTPLCALLTLGCFLVWKYT